MLAFAPVFVFYFFYFGEFSQPADPKKKKRRRANPTKGFLRFKQTNSPYLDKKNFRSRQN
jgi:hypothetical protein